MLREWTLGLDKSLNATGIGSGRAPCAVVAGRDVVVLISRYAVVLAIISSSTVTFELLDASTGVKIKGKTKKKHGFTWQWIQGT